VSIGGIVLISLDIFLFMLILILISDNRVMIPGGGEGQERNVAEQRGVLAVGQGHQGLDGENVYHGTLPFLV
jgi:hypothetical protein